MYLSLYHGRTDPNADMNDWGTEGPVFEVDTITWTYGAISRIIFPDDDEVWLNEMIVDDMIYYDGVYYGDWSVSSKPLYPENIQEIDHDKKEHLCHK